MVAVGGRSTIAFMRRRAGMARRSGAGRDRLVGKNGVHELPNSTARCPLEGPIGGNDPLGRSSDMFARVLSPGLMGREQDEGPWFGGEFLRICKGPSKGRIGASRLTAISPLKPLLTAKSLLSHRFANEVVALADHASAGDIWHCLNALTLHWMGIQWASLTAM